MTPRQARLRRRAALAVLLLAILAFALVPIIALVAGAQA